ncbi:MAG: hypothetical protein HRU40_18570, partial [Saprospiraceae bacterium]|nr:hypothetical protein [Saprospiraceae bacterium]
MKIMYLTWGETPRSYGVFNSQVISQFIETKKIMEDDEFYFLSALPIIHSGLIREKTSYFSTEFKAVKNRLNKAKVEFAAIPIYAPQNFVTSAKNTFKFMHFGALKHFLKILNKVQPDVIHCRSYHAAFAAINAREKYGLFYKVIFDVRGLWPEEVALKKGWDEK